MGRVGVEEANPEVTGRVFNSRSRVQRVAARAGSDLTAVFELLGRSDAAAVVLAQIQAVVGRVLRDQVELLHTSATGRWLPDDLQGCGCDGGRGCGNDAEAARMVAALSDLYVSEMAGREPETWSAVVGNVGRGAA